VTFPTDYAEERRTTPRTFRIGAYRKIVSQQRTKLLPNFARECLQPSTLNFSPAGSET